jgi:ATP-dependent Lon protease
LPHGDSGMIGVYKIETEVVSGTGKFERTGLGTSREARENLNTAFNYFKANKKNISGAISLNNNDFLMHVQDMQGIGMTSQLTLVSLYCPLFWALKKPVLSQLVVLGSMSIGGTINKVEELASTLQVCFDAGAKKILLPMASAADINTVPPELFC